MVNISIDVTDLGGEARPGDKVVLWKPAAAGSATHAGRVISTAPVDVFLTNGKATVPDVEPGSMRVLLQCRGVESQGPIDVTVPDGTGIVTLRSLIESQFEYSPPIVSAVQQAADNAAASERAAIQAQVRSEAAADRAEARVDDAINNGANLVRDEVKQDADRAVSARQAAVQAESNAAASENAAASSASNAATSETNAKQSETNAGDYAAVATTAATEAVDAMERATEVVGGDFATREHVNEVTAQLSDGVEKATRELESRLVLGSGSEGSRSIGPAGSTFPWYPGLVTFDDFRTPGEVVGSASFSGATWSGGGSWLSDGEVARPVGISRLSVQAGLPPLSAEMHIEMETARTGTAQTWRLFLAASSPTADDGIWLGISISATGVASCSAYITSGGSSRQLAGYTGLSPTGASVDTQGFTPVRFDVGISGKVVTIKAIGKDGEVELSGELTPEELESLGEWVTVRSFTGKTPGFALSEILVETDQRTSPEPVRLATVDDSGTISESVIPERLSEAALLQLIKSQQPDAAGSGLDALATKIAFSGAGQHSIGVVSDSSMNDGNDSLRIFDRMLATRLPSPVRHVYHNWNTADADWRHTVNSEGETTPGHDGTVLIDTFSRESSSLVGSSPDTGAAWEGNGTWISDGSVARANSIGALAVNAGNRSMSIDTDLLIDLSGAANQRFDIIIAAPHAQGNGGAMVSFSIGATGSLGIVAYTWDGRWVKMGNTIWGSSIGLTSDSGGPQAVNVAFTLDIQNLSVTVTGPGGAQSLTGQISESQYIDAGTWARLFALTEDTSAFAVDSVSVTTSPQPPQGDILEIWNGAMGGAKLGTFDEARINQMFTGVSIDTVIISMGHNNRDQTGADFVTELETWLGLWKQLHPETKSFIWVSQNPQFAPAASVISHRDRQLAIREAHRRLGMDYVGGYEAIASQPDGGASLVQSDGIHPTTPPIGVIEGDYGAVKVAEAIMESVDARI